MTDHDFFGGRVHVKTGALYVQAGGCVFCLHVGSVAVFFGRRRGYGARLELFTHDHRFRFRGGAA